jgi:hypothetical protein
MKLYLSIEAVLNIYEKGASSPNGRELPVYMLTLLTRPRIVLAVPCRGSHSTLLEAALRLHCPTIAVLHISVTKCKGRMVHHRNMKSTRSTPGILCNQISKRTRHHICNLIENSHSNWHGGCYFRIPKPQFGTRSCRVGIMCMYIPSYLLTMDGTQLPWKSFHLFRNASRTCKLCKRRSKS